MLDEETLRRVLSQVRTFLSPVYDHESIAMDICLESWQNEVEHPTRTFIRQRCYDVLRRSQMEKKATKSLESRPSSNTSKDLEDRDQVEKLVAVLNINERKVIWYRFYADLPIREIAKRLKQDVNSVRETLSNALYKMRVEGLEHE